MLTSPRGSKNATFESLDTASNDLSASAKDSALDFPKLGAVVFPPLLDAAEEAVAGLNRPAQAFGLAQALGGGEMIVACSAGASLTTVAPSLFSFCSASGIAFSTCGSSGAFSDTILVGSRATAFGSAGITGTAGKVDLLGFGATGVVSPGAGNEGCCIEDGVVGFVDSVASEAGRLVEGVSGRGSVGSARAGSSVSALGPGWSCWMIGSFTGSADNCGACFFFRLGFLAGHGASGWDNQGNCILLEEL